MVDKQAFYKEVKTALDALKDVTKDIHEKRRLQIKIERDQKDQETNEMVYKRLAARINEIDILQTEYMQITIGLLLNDIRRVSEKVVQGEIDYVEESKFNKYYQRRVNHYQLLPVEMKESLFHLAQTKLTEIPTWETDMYLSYLETDLKVTLSAENERLLIEHLRKIAIAYVKSYIFQNQPYAYLPEALPSALWLLEVADEVDLSFFTIFQYPSVLTTKDSEASFKEVLKEWYKEKGQFITSFETQLNEKIAEGEYKSARRLFSRYGYLFDVSFYQEKEVILLSMLYKKYQDCMKIEQPIDRQQALFEIEREIMKFNVVE